MDQAIHNMMWWVWICMCKYKTIVIRDIWDISSPLQINQSFLIDDVRRLGRSYVIQTKSQLKWEFMEFFDIMFDGKYVNLQETFKEVVEDDDGVFE